MLDKLTDNMKYFIMLMVYVVYLTWWAATLNTSVEQQVMISQKTVILLDAHIAECNRKKVTDAIIYQDLKHLKKDVDGLLVREKNRDMFRVK